jgi:hypothetical protein
MNMAGTEKKKLMPRGARALIVGISLGALFAACSNMLTGNDLKAKIGTDVTEANAQSVSVTMAVSPSGAGTVSPPIGTQAEKVGVGFSIAAFQNNAYNFANWTATGSGNVVFSDANSASTTATVGVAASDIKIIANFIPRPTIIDYSPTGTDKLRNLPIYVQFSTAMDITTLFDQLSTTLSSANISVTSKAAGTPAAPTSIASYFTPSLSTDKTILTLQPTTSMDATQKVTVTVSKNVKDLSGNTMADDFSWYFTTNTTTDPSVPSFGASPLSVLKGSGTTSTAYTLPDGSYATNTRTITINSSALSNSSSGVTVTGMQILEKDLTSLATTSNWYGYLAARDYALQTSGDGEKTLTITLQNSNGNISASTETVTVYLDTVKPTIDSMTLASSNGGYAKSGDSVTLTISASDAAGSGFPASAPTINIAGHSASVTGSSGSYVGSYTVTTGTTQGAVSYSAIIADLAGNQTTVSTGATGSVTVDTTAPTIGTLAISSDRIDSHAAFATTGDSLKFVIAASDTGGSGFGTVGGTIAGMPATVTGSAGNYTLSYKLLSADGVADGIPAYSITVQDGAGNATTITNASHVGTAVTGGVAVDRTAPVATTLAIASDHASHPTYAKDNDTITLTYALSEASGLSSASAVIAGSSSQIGNATKTSYKLLSANAVSDGVVAFTLTLTDVLGNSRDVSAVTDGSAVTIDRTAPNFYIGNATYPLAYSSNTISLYLSSAETSGLGTVSYWLGTGAKPGTSGTVPSSSVYVLKSPGSTVTALNDLVSVALTGIGTSSFRFTLSDVLGNETTYSYQMAYSSPNWAYSADATPFKSILAGYSSGMVPRSGIAVSHAQSGSSSYLPIVPISFIDPVIYSSRAEASQETGANSLDRKALEARYAPPIITRAGTMDASSMSLIGRSAAAAAKAARRTAEVAGRSAETVVEARLTLPPAATTGEPSMPGASSAASTSASVSQSAQGGGSPAQPGAAAPVSEPQPLPKGPSSPVKAPAPGVDLYVNQSRTKREDASGPLDDAEGSDIL